MSIKERQNNATRFRYIAPLMVEEACLECHAHQAYQVGDVRGSLAVSFNIDAIESTNRKTLVIIIGLALASFASLAIIIYRLVHRLSQRLEAAEEKLHHQAITDELTGLRNRRYLLERLHAELTEMRRTDKPLACILFDLDHFKRVNDTFGHEAGDETLCMVANVVKEQCRENDILSRFGGEEFVVVLPETTLEAALDIAERLRESILSCQVSLANGKMVTVSASFGVAWIEQLTLNVGETETELLKQADVALYRAKEYGRNRVEIYS